MDGNSELQGLGTSQRKGLGPENQALKTGKSRWVGRLTKTFGGVFNKEKKIEGHKINVVVESIKHRTEEETRDLKERFQKTDVFVPEMFGWTEDYLSALRSLSFGEITPEDILLKRKATNQIYFSRDAGFLELIYNSKKAIVLIDVPKNHPLDFREQDLKFPEIEFGNDFNQCLESVKQYTSDYAKFQKEREKYILKQFKLKIQETINTYPQLKEKQDINVLVAIGEAHDLLSSKLRDKHWMTEASKESSELFFYNEEAMIKNMHGESVDNDLAARIITERLLFRAFKDTFFTESTKSSVKSIREFVSKFSYDEMRNLYNGVHDIGEWGKNIRDAYHAKQGLTTVVS